VTDTTDRLAEVLAPVLAEVGLDCYDVEVSGPHKARTLRVLVNRAEGIDLEAITAATKALTPVLDADPAVARALPGSYLLEVSSPGIERPLRTPGHFRGATGLSVSLKYRTESGGVERERVVVVAADDDGVEVDRDGTHLRVAYADIVQARTVFEWGGAPKPGSKPKRSTGRTSPESQTSNTHTTQTSAAVPAHG